MDTDKFKCLEEPSKFSSHKSMCYWDEEKELAAGHNDTYASDWNKFLAFCHLLKIDAINVPST